MEVCDAPNRLLVTLEPGAPDRTEVEACLVVEDDGTRLIVEERGLPVGEGPGPRRRAGRPTWRTCGPSSRAATRVPWRERWHQLIASYRPEQQ